MIGLQPQRERERERGRKGGREEGREDKRQREGRLTMHQESERLKGLLDLTAISALASAPPPRASWSTIQSRDVIFEKRK